MSPFLFGLIDSQKSGHLSAPAYDSLATVSLTSTATTISGLPTSGYKHLQLFVKAASSYTMYNGPLYLTFNGDGSNSYAWHALQSDYGQTTTTGSNGTSYAYYRTTDVAGSYDSPYFGVQIINIYNFLKTDRYKTIEELGGMGNTSYPIMSMRGGTYLKTNTLTSITLTTSNGNFVTGSQATLFGIK